MVSSKGLRFPLLSSRFFMAIPFLAMAYIVVKFSCSSFAPRSKNNSNISSCAFFGLAAFLSILFKTTMGLWPISSDFFKTKRVWGIGPSWASTTKRTQSIERRMRSTSEPKSACPGVSTKFIFVSLYITDAFLE